MVSLSSISTYQYHANPNKSNRCIQWFIHQPFPSHSPKCLTSFCKVYFKYIIRIVHSICISSVGDIFIPKVGYSLCTIVSGFTRRLSFVINASIAMPSDFVNGSWWWWGKRGANLYRVNIHTDLFIFALWLYKYIPTYIWIL